jgi:hypothetical protein
MDTIHIFNPSTGPVVYSLDGHVLGGGEHVYVASLDSRGERAVKRGYIVIIEGWLASEEVGGTKARRSVRDETAKGSGAS